MKYLTPAIVPTSADCYCIYITLLRIALLPNLFRNPSSFSSVSSCPPGSLPLESLLVVRELGVQVTTKYVDGREKSTVRLDSTCNGYFGCWKSWIVPYSM